MAIEKRIAVTLPAGPKLTQTIDRIRWAEEHGIPDGWFSDAGSTVTSATMPDPARNSAVRNGAMR